MAQKKSEKKKSPKTPISAEMRLHEFVAEYVKDFNGTRAYMAVFGLTNEKSAGAEASRYLSDDRTRQYLNTVLKQRREALHLDAQYVVSKLVSIVEEDFTQVSDTMTWRQIQALPKAVRTLIQGIKMKKSKFENESAEGRYNSRETQEFEVTWMSKDKALDALGKHTGTYAKDNIKGQVDLGKMSYTDMMLNLAKLEESQNE